MTQPAPLVSLDCVDVDIDGQAILHDIAFEISSGHHWGIVGANGSGKSTLLALLSGRVWPAPGRGRRVYDFGSGPERDAITARERVALFSHELQDLYSARRWNFRARDIVHSGLTRTDIPQRRASQASLDEATDLLERMNLGHLADRRLLELSRGEQRRVLITRSLAFKPALLLLDEPASGLDSASRQELEAMLAVVAERTQIVTTSHQLDELPAIVTDRAILEGGRLRAGEAVDATARARARARARAASRAVPEANDHDAAPAQAGNVMIELEAASAWFGGRQVLKELDWKLESGESWLITGNNGAGKSTLLRMLHAEIRPARGGSIAWPGLGDPRNVWDLRQKIALVSAEFQARYRYPTRVFDAVASGFQSSIGLVRKLTREQNDRVVALLDDFELTALGDRLLATLSYGQRHRALIARIFATDPKILLLDEPWEGLDSETSDIVAEQVGRRIASGAQVVCVSHVGPRSLSLNRRMTLAGGRIVYAGDSVEPRENSANARSPATNCRQH
jgi:molybdate transport system ATP-binding protein